MLLKQELLRRLFSKSFFLNSPSSDGLFLLKNVIWECEGSDGMNKLVDVLSWVALKCTQNKYLNAIKNTFQNYMPISLAGAVGIFWINVLVNDQGGLGTVFHLLWI